MPTNLAQIEFATATGQKKTLNDFKGKVALIVNVASKCGLTPQYEGLEQAFEKYGERGFTVLGFPANEFAGQEPGSNDEIQEFCRMNFGIKFPVFGKIVVKGANTHPLYQALIQAQPQARKKPDGSFEKKLAQHGLLTGEASEISWNFEKFLLSRNGDVVARFAPDIAPDDPELVKAIEQELQKT